MASYSTQDYHDKITQLFDAYYVDKRAGGEGTPLSDRLASSNDLIEHYVKAYDKKPPASVLSRLAAYIDLDYASDSNPHKASADEYPVLSGHQLKRRRDR